ncbi:MAG: hypothetical protein R6T89_02145 [Candidatus Syntrophosphaera sp.]
MDEKMGDLSKKCFLLLQVLDPYANRNLRKLRLKDFFPKVPNSHPYIYEGTFFQRGVLRERTGYPQGDFGCRIPAGLRQMRAKMEAREKTEKGGGTELAFIGWKGYLKT